MEHNLLVLRLGQVLQINHLLYLIGVNFQAVGIGGDNTRMRCRFGDSVVFPDPLQVPDPVDFVPSPGGGGEIHCTSPASASTAGTNQVVFGICLVSVDCEYTGKARQAAVSDTYHPSVNVFTKSSLFLYYKTPQLTSLTPSLGPREGSTHVTIKGIGFLKESLLSASEGLCSRRSSCCWRSGSRP